MEVVDHFLSEVKHLRPRVFTDGRGFFRETYRKPLYESLGITCDFVQDNHSYSQKGTIRGMHFQRFPGQAKLITVMKGRIFDVFVDMRRESATFGKWDGVYLDAERGDQVFIPAGYAHGFCVVSEDAHVCYKVSTVYDPLEERCFRYNDPLVGIEWPIQHPLLSERDTLSPSLEEALR